MLSIAVASILVAYAPGADAYGIKKRKPEIEVHLEVLNQFRGMSSQQAQPAQQYSNQTQQSVPEPAINYSSTLPPTLGSAPPNYNSQQGAPLQQRYSPAQQYTSGTIPPAQLPPPAYASGSSFAPGSSDFVPPAQDYQPAQQYNPAAVPPSYPQLSAPVSSSNYSYSSGQPKTMNSAQKTLPDSRYAGGRPLPASPKSGLARAEPELPAFRAPDPIIDEPPPAAKAEKPKKEKAKKEKPPEEKAEKPASTNIDREFDSIFKNKGNSEPKPLPPIQAEQPNNKVASAEEILSSVPDLPTAKIPEAKSKETQKPAAPMIEPPSLDSILGDIPAATPSESPPPLPDLPANSTGGTKTPPPPPALPSAKSASPASVYFKAGEAELSEDAKKKLRDIATSLKNSSDRIEIVAYASGTDDKLSDSRRISLSRAQAVRDFLKDSGIAPDRIVPQAKGNQGGGESPDRVDIAF